MLRGGLAPRLFPRVPGAKGRLCRLHSRWRHWHLRVECSEAAHGTWIQDGVSELSGGAYARCRDLGLWTAQLCHSPENTTPSPLTSKAASPTACVGESLCSSQRVHTCSSFSQRTKPSFASKPRFGLLFLPTDTEQEDLTGASVEKGGSHRLPFGAGLTLGNGRFTNEAVGLQFLLSLPMGSLRIISVQTPQWCPWQTS